MNSKYLFKLAGFNVHEEFEVKGLALHANEVLDHYIFFAKKGAIHDGHDYIDLALCNGAKIVICEKDVGKEHCYPVEKIDEVIANIAYLYSQKAVDDLLVIGVTGTNGKTTTSTIIYEMLENLGENCALIGTNGLKTKNTFFPLNNTTPDPILLHKKFKEFKEQGIKYVIMEVSSHALTLHRVDHISFHIAIFTNFASDHLDFHHTIDEYFHAKLKMFKSLSKNAIAIINHDMPYRKRIINSCPGRVISFGIQGGILQAHRIKLSLDSTQFYIRQFMIESKLTSHFNIYNMLAAIACLKECGYCMKDIINTIQNIEKVDGRLEIVSKAKAIGIVDFAHTTQAVASVLTFLNVVKTGKIITIIGCGGNRDTSKRKDMGLLSSNMSDTVIFTSDNPRFEEPQKIIDDMTKQVKKQNYYVIIDRALAIAKAVSIAKENDIILILGKGSENYQIIKEEKHYFNDKEELIKAMEGKK